jgi:hypothetical protein
MSLGKTGKREHAIVFLNYRRVTCACGWERELAAGEYGIMTGYDRLLDLHTGHKSNCAELDK